MYSMLHSLRHPLSYCFAKSPTQATVTIAPAAQQELQLLNAASAFSLVLHWCVLSFDEPNQLLSVPDAFTLNLCCLPLARCLS